VACFAAFLAAIFARRAAVLRQQLVVMEQLNDTAAARPDNKTLVFKTNSEDQSATPPPTGADQSAAFANQAYEDTGYTDMDGLDELRAQL